MVIRIPCNIIHLFLYTSWAYARPGEYPAHFNPTRCSMVSHWRFVSAVSVVCATRGSLKKNTTGTGTCPPQLTYAHGD